MLNSEQRLELYYWMRLTRAFDDAMLAWWKQGRGVGGTFSQRGHEATSVGAAATLLPDDVIAPMHRDLGAYLLRGLTPRRIFAGLLGRATGVTGGRDANFHGMSDMDLKIIGFISHLTHSLAAAVGVAMSFTYRNEARVALAFVGDGSTSLGLFHEAMNLAAVQQAPLVVVVENNQYAYSTPLAQQMRGRFGFELRMIVMGGERILYKIHQVDGDVFRQRPVLDSRDWAYMVWRALRKK